MKTLNLGILAHVDAGKTSLTERLLYAAKVIDKIGSVDDGNTQTDSLALERQRGITIKSAVATFAIDDVTVNLIDTPGHPDFIAEVERVLSVLDGAVLVISAVEGVQAQTRILMRALQRLRIPTLIFVNKIDRGGAQYEALLHNISAKLTSAIVPMGSVTGLGTREAAYHQSAELPVDVLADHDDEIFAAYVDATVSYRRLKRALATQAKRAQVHPVFFGSAITGAGVDALTAGLTELLPAMEGDAEAPVSGTVFKVERGPAGEKIAYVRMFSGTLRTRDRVRFGHGNEGEGKEGKVTGIEGGEQVAAGQIAKLWGLREIQIGDTIGEPRPMEHHQFSPPTLETVVIPRGPRDKGALHVALTQLAEQDPLINLRQDEIRQEISVSLYGEVQKEVIEATLVNDFGVEVSFRETTTICIERPIGHGAAVEFIAKAPNPFLATVGLRVEPAQVGSGVQFKLEVELGSMPFSFFKAIEETVKETLQQGIHGWEVTDCTIFMTHSGYWPRQSRMHGTFDKSMSSTAGDFRNLTPLVLMDALKQAGTKVYEPIHRFSVELPADALGSVQSVLTGVGAVTKFSMPRGSSYIVEGEIPVAQVHQLQQRLPGATHGEGVLESAFAHYQPVRGTTPTRARWDNDPLNREEYLLHVVRRV